MKKHETKLLKCPFCGADAELISDGGGEMSSYAVMCKQCHAMTAFYLDDEKRAIEAWNTRVKAMPSPRLAEYLAERLTP